MLINGINLSAYHAVLLSKDIQTSEVVVFSDWLSASSSPLYAGKKVTYNTIKCQMLIEAASDQLCIEYISKLASLFIKGILKFDDLDFFYDFIISTKTSTRLKKGYHAFEVELKSSSSWLPETTISFGSVLSHTLSMPGNLETPAMLTITPSVGMASVTISGLGLPITVKDLHGGVPIIIDGEKCLVTENGLNKFMDTEMWSFPSLIPGTNIITLNQNGLDCQLKFKPKFM